MAIIFDLNYAISIIPEILKALPLTGFLTLASMALAILLGLIMALIRISKIPVLYQLAGIYISIFRGFPTLVLLFLVYYGGPQVFPSLSTMGAVSAAIVGLSLHESGYLAEIFRAAIISVDQGQREAAKTVGMGRWALYSRVVLPQAAYNAIPSTGNIFIQLIKNTSVTFTLGIADIFATAQELAGGSFKFLESYVVVGCIYWAIVVLYSWFQEGWLEKKIGRKYER